MATTTDRFRAALRSSDDEALAAWAATGADGVALLRSELSGRPTVAAGPGIHPRDVIDNLTAATAAIAAAQPMAFLDAFADPRWAWSGLVVGGLGEIDDPRATARLVDAIDAEDWTVRATAARGLGRRGDPAATAALVELVDDPEYLVRHHALESLARIGDPTALRALGRSAWPTTVELELAAAARDAIQRRHPGR